MWSWGRLGVCGISWVSKWWHLHQIEAPIRISGKRMLRRKRELRRLPALMSSWSLLKGRGIIAQVVVVESSVGGGSCFESPDLSQASFIPSLFAVIREDGAPTKQPQWPPWARAYVHSIAWPPLVTWHLPFLSSLTLTTNFQISFF